MYVNMWISYKSMNTYKFMYEHIYCEFTKDDVIKEETQLTTLFSSLLKVFFFFLICEIVRLGSSNSVFALLGLNYLII